MIRARFLKLLTKAGVVALFLAGLATAGNAQNAYQGKFTLPFETHWAGATLPAGDYTFVLQSTGFPYRLYIRGQETNVIIQANTAEEGMVSKVPQLNILDITDLHTVQTFEAPELGVTFTYWTPTQKRTGRTEAHQKMAPQTAPTSQVTENRTSIAVHTAGR